MYRISKVATASAFLVLSFFSVFTPAEAGKAGLKGTAKGTAVLWRDPADIGEPP